MAKWLVYLNGKHINTVYYDSDMKRDEVLRSLIEHDGFPTGIIIIKSAL